MTKVFSTRLLALTCLLLIIGMAISCKKDNDVSSDKIELLSFGPTGARHGDTLRFVGLNLDKVTAIELTGATIPQSGFISQSPELILIVVPKAAQEGFVKLKTPPGDITSKTRFNLLVSTTITGMTAQARPGENITINGEYLNWVTRVTFANNKNVDSFVSRTINQLVVTVPTDAQTGPLLITYSGTEPKQITTADTLKVTLPVVAGISPNPVKHQTNLTITGTNLDLAKQVLFQGVATPVTAFVSQTATQIVVRVPAGAQKGKLSLVAASGVATQSAVDLDVLLPSVTSMSPNPVDPLADLTITGTNLDLVTSVSFIGALAPVTTFVSQSVTQVVVKVPAGTLKGKVTLAVLNSTLTVQSSADLLVNGGLPPLADFSLGIYTDALLNTFQDWSYTDVHDFNSTANVRQGTTSIKAVYASGGYQGVTFHAGTAVSTTGFTKIEFSVFGEAGTGGKNINVVVNGNYGAPAVVTLLAGEWSTFSVNLSAVGNPTTLSEIVLQSAGWGGTVHIDHVGLR